MRRGSRKPGHGLLVMLSLAVCLPKISEQSIAPVIGRSMPLDRTRLEPRPGLSSERGGEHDLETRLCSLAAAANSAAGRSCDRPSLQARCDDPMVECERWISQIDKRLAGLQMLSSIVEAEEMLAGGRASEKSGAKDAAQCVDEEEQAEIRAMLEEMQRQRDFAKTAAGREVLLLDRGLEGEEAAERDYDDLAQEHERQEERAKARLLMEAARLSSRDAMSKLQVQVLRYNPWLMRYPLLLNTASIRHHAAMVAKQYRGKFCWSTDFSPKFLAALIKEGYLPMAESTMHGPAPYILLPKMHQERCILRFPDLHVQRSVRKRAGRFDISCDTCFERVIRSCQQQHGENWLYPPIVEAFKAIYAAGVQGVGGVRMHSFEIWEKASGELVAGEMGYSVGGCYTSLSGFFTVDSAGSVQCVAAARLLQQAGAAFWDLGMALDYKLRMGAKCVPRADFLSELAVQREQPAILLPQRRLDCKQFALPSAAVEADLVGSRATGRTKASKEAGQGEQVDGAGWDAEAKRQFAENLAAWERERRVAAAAADDDLSSVSSVSSPPRGVRAVVAAGPVSKGSPSSRKASDNPDRQLRAKGGERRGLVRNVGGRRRRLAAFSPGSLLDASAEADMSWISSAAGTPKRGASPLPVASSPLPSSPLPNGMAGKEAEDDLSSSMWGDLFVGRDWDGATSDGRLVNFPVVSGHLRGSRRRASGCKGGGVGKGAGLPAQVNGTAE